MGRRPCAQPLARPIHSRETGLPCGSVRPYSHRCGLLPTVAPAWFRPPLRAALVSPALPLAYLASVAGCRLPVGARRAAFVRLSAWRAPAVSVAAEARQPIVIVGLLKTASGLSDAARKSHDALKAAGFEVYGIDVTATLMHEANYPDFRFDDGHGLVGAGTLIIHASGPSIPRVMAFLGRRLVTGKRVVAHWFWELPKLPGDWRSALPFVHDFCASTRFVADAIRPLAGARPVHVVNYPLTVAASGGRAPAAAARPFTALVLFNIASNFARKNPCAAIRAFRRAFGDDPGVKLMVKYLNAAAWPEAMKEMRAAAGGAANIVMNDAVLDDAGIEALYAESDVVVSLHRAEGLGLAIAEAMMRGIPVIATNWSGNTDFFTAACGFPISYRLVPIEDPQANYAGKGVAWDDPADARWADPDVEEAAAALRALKGDPDLCRRLGAAGREQARAFFDPALHVERVSALLVKDTPR